MKKPLKRKSATVGDWVEISAVLLAPGERSPNLPPETAAVPLVMRVRGWAQKAGRIGAKISVKTQAGRVLHGKLLAVNPRFDHDFGGCVPELIDVRRRLKELMAKGGAP
ncbi:MAG TPA: 2-amino-4-oxopentanoate thiolase subunit OrtA [Planctomycetota bacterium]|nr:2-amino-4-oxopentanoate thiolase subunit OrtA [Planctomycetota bacterium]